MAGVNYADRDADQIRASLLADPVTANFPPNLINALAQFGDTISNNLNVIANMLFPQTTLKPRSEQARDLAQIIFELLDYHLSWKPSASADFQFTIDGSYTVSSDYTIPKEELIVLSPAGFNTPSAQYEALESLTILLGETTGTVRLYARKTSAAPVSIGTTDGSEFQALELPELDIIAESIVIQIDVDTYTLVNNFSNSSAIDANFRIFYRSNGTSRIMLPGVNQQDGTQFGLKPAPDQTVTASWAVGYGLDGNYSGTITDYTGGNDAVTGVINLENPAGGGAPESVENARIISPLAMRTAEYWTIDSTLIALLSQNIPGILSSQFVPDPVKKYAGTIYVIPVGGGLPSTQLKQDVQDFAISRSILRQAEIIAADPNYLDTAISGQAVMLPGKIFSDAKKYIELALALRSSELGISISRTFHDAGLESAINEINSTLDPLIPYLDTGGAYEASRDGAQISRFFLIVAGQQNIPYQVFGEDLNPGDLLTAVQGFVFGIDYFLVTLPSSSVIVGPGGFARPVSIAVTQI